MAGSSRMRYLHHRLVPWLLAVALLWAHSLGLWHRVAHPSIVMPFTLATLANVQVNPGAEHAHGWLAHLFDGHSQGADCLGFDHGLLGAALLAAYLALAAAAQAQRRWTPRPVPACRVRWAAFSARAPP